MELMICVGSSCHLKGSREIIQLLDRLLKEHHLDDKIILKGSFCMGCCTGKGVSVKFNDTVYSVTPESAEEFFHTVLLGCV